MPTFSLAVFASGHGSNCQAIQTAIETGRLDARIGVVISNNPNAGVLAWAKTIALPAIHVSSDQFATTMDFHNHLLTMLSDFKTDMIVLAGYLKKIGKPLLEAFPGRILNIHPALLPSFGGKGMFGRHVHEAVLASGVRLTGVTVHLVDEEYDRGPIVMQAAVDVSDDDTVESLSAKVLSLEHRTYPLAIQLFVDGRVEIAGRKVRIRNKQ